MEDKIVKSIREAEQKAKSIVEDANRQSEKILLEAKESSKSAMKDAENTLSSLRNSIQSEKTISFEKEKNRILNEGKKEAQQLEKEALKNHKKAVEFVLKKFEEEIDNA